MKTLFSCRYLIPAIAVVASTVALPTEAALRRAVQTETFQVASNAVIVVGENHAATLGNLKIGDRVGIGYTQENGASVVHHIADGVPHKPRNPSTSGTPSVKSHPHTNANGMLHAHGVVQAVNLQAGTVTIAHRGK